jgi:mannose-6-phosphate isomerase
MGKIVKLKPFMVEKPWGTHKLASLKEVLTNKLIGESWEVSTHPAGSSFVEDYPLSEICELSYLVKFIDTGQNLSIQVHPDDDYAKKIENSKGKTECWMILNAKKDAGIYLGFKPHVTRKEFFNALTHNLSIENFLNFIPVKKGDFFYLPPGSIHAIGGGVTLCEIQQSSDITYRVWDWNRQSETGEKRKLHIDQAKEVLNFNQEFNQGLIHKQTKKNIFHEANYLEIAKHSDFNVQLFSTSKEKTFEIRLKAKESIIVLEGSLKMSFHLNPYESAIVLEDGLFEFTTSGQCSFIIVSEGT